MLCDSTGPLVCICIPTYNVERTLAHTLRSLLSQTYRRLLITIVDNASTDDTLAIARSFDDPRVVVLAHDEHVTGENSFNRCIAYASGDYTAIYHADDVYGPEMVQQQVTFLNRHPNVGGVLSEAFTIDDSGKRLGRIRVPSSMKTEDNCYTFEQLFKAVLKHSNFMVCPSAMVRTDVYQQTIVTWRGNLFASSADLDIWFRIAWHHGLGILPMPLMNYRINPRQVSAHVRRSSARSDFFVVMDYYLQQENVQSFMTSSDRAAYDDLERRNVIMRATNLFIEGQLLDAKVLLDGVFGLKMCQAAMKNRRGVFTLSLACLLKLFLFFKMACAGKYILTTLLGRLAR